MMGHLKAGMCLQIWKEGASDLVWLGQNESSGCVPCIKHFPICFSFQFQASSTLAQGSRWSQLPLCGSGRSGSTPLVRDEGEMRWLYLAVPCGSVLALAC